ncbi:GDP-L-fucose synthase [uncultured archaeon]|nr:GDP-L-fucose synthase [uncultured archaeon]
MVVEVINLDKTYRGKKVLITGGLGFIGSNLAHELVKLGSDVTILDSLYPKGGGNLFNIKGIEEKINLNFADMRDNAAVKQLVKDKDYIFNLAAQLSHVESMENPFEDLEINCLGTLTLLEACRKYNCEAKIIFSGTRSQYGKIVYTPVDEKHPITPVDTNGISKHAAEQYHLLYYRTYGIKTTSLRLTNTYGPRHLMRHSKQGFLNWFIRQTMDNEVIKIYGDGMQVRDFHYVDDVVQALLIAGESKKSEGEIFNLGGESSNLIDLVRLIIKIAQKGNFELIPFPDERKKIEIGNYIANYEKVKRTLGWEPKTGLEEGIRKTVDFYEKNRKEYW